VRARRRRVLRVAAAGDRLEVLVVAVASAQPVLRVELYVDLRAALLQRVVRVHVHVQTAAGFGGKRAVGSAEGEGLWIALVFVVSEEVDAILDDRAAERAADL